MDRRLVAFTIIVSGWMLAPTGVVRAQQPQQHTNDEQARSLFEAGSAYYERGDFELAMQQFMRSYELSPRPALLYNIGIAAERAGELETAEAHYQRFLAEGTPSADQERRVSASLERLRRRRVERERMRDGNDTTPSAAERTADDDAARPHDESAGSGGTGPVAHGGSRSLVGPIVLGAAGIAALGIVAVGVLGAGCAEEDPSGVCAEERNVNGVAAAIYGGLGVAAIAGAIVWLLVGANDGGGEEDSAESARGSARARSPVRATARGLEVAF